MNEATKPNHSTAPPDLKAVICAAFRVLGGTDTVALQLLLDAADSRGLVTLSARQLAELLGTPRRTAIVIFQRLRAKKVIVRVKGGGAGQTSTHRIDLGQLALAAA